MDERVIRQLTSGTGKLINSQAEVGGWPELRSAPAPQDTDLDGMPDAWERQFGLSPTDAKDAAGDRDSDGYTNLEEFLSRTDPAARDAE